MTTLAGQSFIPRDHRKTKIIATLGPASRSPERIRELITSGANVFRLNFSHGTHEEHKEVLDLIRAICKETKHHCAVLQDLSGPKIRISNVATETTNIEDNEKVVLKLSDGTDSSAETIYVESLNPAEVLQPGQIALLADGIITLEAESIKNGAVTCRVVKGGRIRSRVGIAFPDSNISIPATTDKDLVDLEWGIKNEVDFVAISFVNNAADILRLREALKRENSEVRLISKIERKSALSNIEEIMDVSDGVMVARGDLGLELPLEKVPNTQKELILEANYRGIPVIVATQMLHSMITSIRPTRAEVNDVATAVMQGADAVMLSEETAIGENPGEAVRYLSRITKEAEKNFDFDEYRPRLRDADRLTIPDAVAYAACAASRKINAGAVIACTETGNTARLVAKYRPQQSLYGVSSSEKTLRRMSLYWGIYPIPFEIGGAGTHHDELESALKQVQDRGNFENGSRAVITGGASARNPGSTSIMEIREMVFRE